MAKARLTISVPPKLANEIDSIADVWSYNRSQAIIRIFNEWKHRQLALASIPMETVESIRQQIGD